MSVWTCVARPNRGGGRTKEPLRRLPSPNCSASKLKMIFLLRYLSRLSFLGTRTPLRGGLELDAVNLVLLITREYQGGQHDVCVPFMRGHYGRYVQGGEIVRQLQMPAIRVAVADWQAVERSFNEERAAVGRLVAFAAGVGRSLSPVWRWLTGTVAPHTKPTSACVYCGVAVTHARVGDALGHLLGCITFAEVSTALDPDRQPSWLVEDRTTKSKKRERGEEATPTTAVRSRRCRVELSARRAALKPQVAVLRQLRGQKNCFRVCSTGEAAMTWFLRFFLPGFLFLSTRTVFGKGCKLEVDASRKLLRLGFKLRGDRHFRCVKH